MQLNYDGQSKDYVPNKNSVFTGVLTSNSALGGGMTKGIQTISGGFKKVNQEKRELPAEAGGGF